MKNQTVLLIEEEIVDLLSFIEDKLTFIDGYNIIADEDFGVSNIYKASIFDLQKIADRVTNWNNWKDLEFEIRDEDFYKDFYDEFYSEACNEFDELCSKAFVF